MSKQEAADQLRRMRQRVELVQKQELVAYDYDDNGVAKPSKEPVVTPLTDERLSEIGDATLRVIAGGPYKPEHPVPEGTVCMLTIRDPNRELLKVAKAYTKEPDAASALVNLLVGPVE